MNPDATGGSLVDSVPFQLGVISGQLTALTASVQQYQKQMDGRLEAAETDIQDLKQSRAKAAGWAAGIAAAVSTALTAAGTFFLPH